MSFLFILLKFHVISSCYKVAIFSDNGTTYFYNPEETLPGQLSTGQVRYPYFTYLYIVHFYS
jgi:hypothetical protein